LRLAKGRLYTSRGDESRHPSRRRKVNPLGSLEKREKKYRDLKGTTKEGEGARGKKNSVSTKSPKPSKGIPHRYQKGST